MRRKPALARRQAKDHPLLSRTVAYPTPDSRAIQQRLYSNSESRLLLLFRTFIAFSLRLRDTPPRGLRFFPIMRISFIRIDNSCNPKARGSTFGLNGFRLCNWQRKARCDVRMLRIVQAALRLGSIALWTVVMRLICSVKILSLSGSVSINIRLMRIRSICICSAGKDCWGMSVTIFEDPILPHGHSIQWRPGRA